MPRSWTEEQKQAMRDRMATLHAEGKLKHKPKKPLVETPAFQEAVASAVEQATQKILADIAAAAQSAPASSSPTVFDASALAMAIAELTDQGSGMKRTPPEVIASRNAAANRMRQLLLDANSRGVVPTYRLVAKTVLPTPDGETLIEPLQRGRDNIVRPTKIRWALVPNLAMDPADEWSERIMATFRESIGNQAPSEAGVNLNISLTDQGHVVSGGAIQQRKDRSADRPNFGALVIDEEGNPFTNNNGGPAYTDVQVLGSIAPPARQTG